LGGAYGSTTPPKLELHPELVFFGRYWSVFLGMYDTITEGNLFRMYAVEVHA